MVLGHDIPKLGFGLMRLPMVGDKVDIPRLKDIADAFLRRVLRILIPLMGIPADCPRRQSKCSILPVMTGRDINLRQKPMWNVNEAEDMADSMSNWIVPVRDILISI